MWAPSIEPFLLNLPRYVEHDKKHLYVKFDHHDWWQLFQNDDDISKGWKGWKGDLLTEDSSENVAVTPIPEGKCDHPMSTYLEDNYIVTVTLLPVIGCLVIFFLVLKLGGTSEKKTTGPECCCAWATVSKYVCVQKAFPYMSGHDWVTLLFSLAISSASSRRKLLLKRSSVEWPSTTAAKPILKVQSSLIYDYDCRERDSIINDEFYEAEHTKG